MAKNPLFPEPAEPTNEGPGYVLPSKGSTIQPLTNEEKAKISANPAADLIREKLEKLYASEPDARAEEREAEAAKPRSKHQQFMYELSTSGKSLADIQTEWHAYYVNLPDDEKHRVWQEFYENNIPTTPQPHPHVAQPAPRVIPQPARPMHHAPVVSADDPYKEDTPASIRHRVRSTVQKHADKLPKRTRDHLSSLMFGLATGGVVLLIFLFGFFNEVIIAPFIQPGRAEATPIIVSNANVDASTTSVIVPKINVQIPVVYDLTSNSEAAVQKGLESGVIHYPTTVKPGEQGNAAFFGHSSNNIFNKGRYKFAFVLLHKLEKDDIFYLTYGGTVYGYKVIDKQVVDPSEVGVLDDISGETATATLITCDPPGTSLHRLVVVGKQISPDPAGNSVPSETTVDADNSTALPSNGPTLWTRLWRSIF